MYKCTWSEENTIGQADVHMDVENCVSWTQTELKRLVDVDFLIIYLHAYLHLVRATLCLITVFKLEDVSCIWCQKSGKIAGYKV